MKLTKTIVHEVKTTKEVWFCGCEINRSSSEYPSNTIIQWEEENHHESKFDDKRMCMVYLCHDKKKFKVENYTE